LSELETTPAFKKHMGENKKENPNDFQPIPSRNAKVGYQFSENKPPNRDMSINSSFSEHSNSTKEDPKKEETKNN